MTLDKGKRLVTAFQSIAQDISQSFVQDFDASQSKNGDDDGNYFNSHYYSLTSCQLSSSFFFFFFFVFNLTQVAFLTLTLSSRL